MTDVNRVPRSREWNLLDRVTRFVNCPVDAFEFLRQNELQTRMLAEGRQVDAGELHMPAHAEVRRVDLQQKASARDGVIFHLQGVGQGLNIACMGFVVSIAEPKRCGAG